MGIDEGSQAWSSSLWSSHPSVDFVEASGQDDCDLRNTKAEEKSDDTDNKRNSQNAGVKKDCSSNLVEANSRNDNYVRDKQAAEQIDDTGNERSGQNATNDLKLRRRRQKKSIPSQVGTAMARKTGQRLAIFLIANLLLVLIFTHTEMDTTDVSTMVILHNQTTTQGSRLFAKKAVDTARRSAIPNLYSYYASTSSEMDQNLTLCYGHPEGLREYEIKEITVKDESGAESKGYFSTKGVVEQRAATELVLVIFVLLMWFFGVVGFAGPIMTFVVVPIEQAVKLLNMLVMDPLGYRSTLQYKKFLTEGDKIATSNVRWSREVLKGMETEFLMSAIVRIGSLMKGF